MDSKLALKSYYVVWGYSVLITKKTHMHDSNVQSMKCEYDKNKDEYI